jgi:hypothetical protein
LKKITGSFFIVMALTATGLLSAQTPLPDMSAPSVQGAGGAKVVLLSLEDALRILVVLAEKGDEHFERAAARFAARATTERRLDLAEARYVLALAEALPRSPDAVALLLRSYCG